MGDFIADEDDDDDDLNQVLGERTQPRYEDARRGRGKASKEMMDILPEGISEDVLVDMYDIFGDGGEYEWAQYEDEVNRKMRSSLLVLTVP